MEWNGMEWNGMEWNYMKLYFRSPQPTAPLVSKIVQKSFDQSNPIVLGAQHETTDAPLASPALATKLRPSDIR